MVEKVLVSIKKYNMLLKGDSVIIGLSGGADSVFLTHVLLELRSIYGFCLRAVHINHLIRGDEALRDENFVINLCEGLGVPVQIHRIDVQNEAAAYGISVEEAGRKVRYEVFERTAGIDGKIAVAHNKNDSAETVLLNLCRGGGLSGVSGIPPVRGNIIRPLIDITRDEIEHYLYERKISFVEDSTNNSLCYSRNLIRNIIIPSLKERINVNVVDNIINFSNLARDEDGYLNSLALEGLNKCRDNGGLDIIKLKEYPEVLQKRIIRAVIKEKASLKNISLQHTEEILKLTHGISGKTVHLPGNLIAVREFGLLKFAFKTEKNQDFYYDLVYNKTVYIKELDMYVEVSPEEINGGRCFYISEITSVLAARNRRPGDKIFFTSINGHKKIKDFFIEKRIPPEERDRILLIAEGSEILWLTDGKTDVFSGLTGKEPDNKAKIYVKIWKGTKR